MSEGEELIWTAAGVPRSRRFDDIYFSEGGGLAEARAVFLDGCGLPWAWAGRRHFTVGELGFGTGLNILALLDLWRRFREPGVRLSVFSIDAHPLPPDEAARALGRWGEPADLIEPLIARWPRRAAGFHRMDLPGLDASLDLAVMDAAAALEAWEGRADAWFLDGFSPSKNAGMWSEAVLAGVARRSAPGALVATYTVAGEVRRGLEAHGFTVAKKPGFGAKRERLEARAPSAPAPARARAPSVAIVGAGIAGAALARAFAALGAQPRVVEAAKPGAGASGNPAALVMPRLDAGDGPIGALYAQAMARAADLYDATPQAVVARGALQLETGPKDPGRFDRIAASALFEPGAVERRSSPEAGLWFRDARVVEPAVVLEAWLGQAAMTRARVAQLERAAGGWRLVDGRGQEFARADIVCLAAAMGCQALAPDLPLAPLRGQASFAPGVEAPRAVIGAGYAIPAPGGMLFGATHDRGEVGEDVRQADHARNVDLLGRTAPALVERVARAPLQGRASIRAVTPDFLPMAGSLNQGDGLFILAGLGSRGFCAAPLLAEHLAAIALGWPSPLPTPLATLVDPGRFVQRERRRARSTGVQHKNATLTSRA